MITMAIQTHYIIITSSTLSEAQLDRNRLENQVHMNNTATLYFLALGSQVEDAHMAGKIFTFW